MSSWQIFVDAGNTFRWEISDQCLPKGERGYSVSQEPVIEHRLPSMADLLLQDCSKLVENREENSERPPMFRTGLGKSVGVTKSSIAKARSILGDLDCEDTDGGHLDGKNNGNNFSKPTFETGLLKPVDTFGSGFQDCSNTDFNMSNSMFQTGSGKAVNISSAGLNRAKALLGLEKNYDHKSSDRFEQTRKHLNSSQHLGWENSCHLEMENLDNLGSSDVSRTPISTYIAKSNSLINEPKEFAPDFVDAARKPPPVKFHTAGGRSISISTDALQRARNLLGDPEMDSFLNEADIVDPMFPILHVRKTTHASNHENDKMTPVLNGRPSNSNSLSRNFTSPLRPSTYQKQLSVNRFEKIGLGNNLINKFDAEARDNTPIRAYNGTHGKPLKSKYSAERVDCSENEIHSGMNPARRLSNGPLADISNSVGRDNMDNKQYFGKKRRLGRVNSVSPFKRPRTSKFVTPLHKNDLSFPNGLSRLARKESCSKGVSMRYPFQVHRLYVKEYISQPGPACIQKKLEDLPVDVRKMSPSAAENYTFHNEPISDCIGPDSFLQMLSQSGASMQYITKEWVSNHYKWIVWKLASYERCYPAKFAGKLLTVSNVLEEFKYRYEREVNHGHRSAIKKILDGDMLPSSMMVLCISSVGENWDPKIGPQSVLSEGDDKATGAKIELTDGWYSVKALLDELLSKKLAAGKLFLGQKLRIWGAKLCGWVGPISPLEVSQTSILLHINGTYRCHWAERLGFSKSACVPLAFRCIKVSGGAVPSTLVGVERIYPILYRERLSNGSFVVRSAKTEAKALQLYNQRRSIVAEGIMSEFQREKAVSVSDEHDSDEGAELLKLLETAAEPELLMAGMSPKQLTSFASYQSKLEEMRQLDMRKSIEKALEVSGLNEREVTPFMRIRVVGLANKFHQQKGCPGKGLITIWNPTEQQKIELTEGQAYAVGGLLPCSSYSGTVYLKARGLTTNWLPLAPSVLENYEPFFTPRSSIKISDLGVVPLCSEFDIAAFVVYVGEVYTEALQKKQWVFVTDGSTSEFYSKESPDALLAISFFLPYVECDSFAPVNCNVAGSVVVFRNLINRPKDQVNNLWVAEATENSDYSLSYDHRCLNHLKDAAKAILKWAKTSSLIIEKLKQDVLSIVRNAGAGKC